MAGYVGEVADTGSLSEILDGDKITVTQIMLVGAAWFLTMLDGYDVMAMSFTAHSIGEELQISPVNIGALFSAGLAGMMIGGMFLAPISDILGRRKMLLACVIAIGVSMLATGIASILWQLVILRFITGLGVGSMLASLTTITSEYTPAKYRSLSVAIMLAGFPLGATLGGFAAAPLITVYGWQSVFLIGGLLTLAMLPVVYFFVPESLQFLITARPPNALEKLNHVLNRMNKKSLDVLPRVTVESEKKSANVSSLLSKSLRLGTVTLWSSFFFCFISLFFLMSWIPKLVINSGLSEAEGVYAAVVLNAGGVMGILTLGWLSSRQSVSIMIAIFLAIAAFLMILFAFGSENVNLLLSLFVIGFFLQGGFTGLYAVAAKIYPTEIRATGVGWAIGVGRFGAVVGPYIGGLFIAAGLSMEINFFIFALPLLGAGYLAYRLAVK